MYTGIASDISHSVLARPVRHIQGNPSLRQHTSPERLGSAKNGGGERNQRMKNGLLIPNPKQTTQEEERVREAKLSTMMGN